MDEIRRRRQADIDRMGRATVIGPGSLDRAGRVAREIDHAAIRATRIEVYALLAKLRLPLEWRPEYDRPDSLEVLSDQLHEESHGWTEECISAA